MLVALARSNDIRTPGLERPQTKNFGLFLMRILKTDGPCTTLSDREHSYVLVYQLLDVLCVT